MIGKEIANKNTKVSKDSKQNISETVTNKHDNEIPKKKYVYPEERRQNIDEPTLK